LVGPWPLSPGPGPLAPHLTPRAPHAAHPFRGGRSAKRRDQGLARTPPAIAAPCQPDPQAAEIAVTIADDWQGRGLGAELLARLSDRARQEGICRFTALVAADNAAMAGLLGSRGAVQVGGGRGTVDYQLALAPAEYSLDWWFDCVDDGSVLAWR